MGPGKQRFFNSLTFVEQTGFRDAATFCPIRDNHPDLAVKGADMAGADREIAAARAGEPSGIYWLGFDIASGLFGDIKMGGLGQQAMTPVPREFDRSSVASNRFS